MGRLLIAQKQYRNIDKGREEAPVKELGTRVEKGSSDL